MDKENRLSLEEMKAAMYKYKDLFGGEFDPYEIEIAATEDDLKVIFDRYYFALENQVSDAQNHLIGFRSTLNLT